MWRVQQLRAAQWKSGVDLSELSAQQMGRVEVDGTRHHIFPVFELASTRVRFVSRARSMCRALRCWYVCV
jgi:hypothetical protein